MNQNPNQLNQLVLRQMLLEGPSGDKIIKAVRRFNKKGQTDEDKAELIGDVRKEVRDHVKDLITDESLSTFIDVLSRNV
jgi:hypothetical protein